MSDYRALRYAPVDQGSTRYVAIGEWVHKNGTTEWTVERWEERGEGDPDKSFPTEEAAESYALEEFGLNQADWIDGPNPFGPNGIGESPSS